MSQPGCSNVSQDTTNVGRKRKADTEINNDDDDNGLRILAPKKKPPLQLISYRHVDNVRGMVGKAREFCRYINRVLSQFSNEVLLYHIPPATSATIPNYMEKCATLLACETGAMRGLLNGFARRMEKFESMLMKMPFPPRDIVRKDHVLNGFSPESISFALLEFSRVHKMPIDMEFSHDELEAVKRIATRKGNHADIIVAEETADGIPEPLEDYSREKEELETRKQKKAEDKKLGGKKILDAKDGIIKMSYTTYHTKVMKLLSDKDVFGAEYKPYKKQYLKAIYNRISSERGDGILNVVIEFFQASYAAYEAIFVEGSRSIFGPADVRSDVQQHLAQIYHYFKTNVSTGPLL